MTEPYDYLAEDLGPGDVTTEALIDDVGVIAVIIAKSDCVLAGSQEATRVFEHQGLRLIHYRDDGDVVAAGTVIMQISGDAKALLASERLALNFIMRMSGIATETRALLTRCRDINPRIRIAATRKTTPGFRSYEKRGVEVGGGDRHREGLYDQILIKDNHLRLVGSISEAVKKARDSGLSKLIEVEVVDLAGAKEAARTGADIIMLDNMAPERAKESAMAVKEIRPEATIEISGGITPYNILDYAEFADVISLGWLTHSVKACDFSLEIVEIPSDTEHNP
jgi:nicotinate-nucleotide pyrophosphorylase (carboxylating)